MTRPRDHYMRELDLLQGEIQSLGRLVIDAVTRTIEALAQRDVEQAATIVAGDQQIDLAQEALERHVQMIIAAQQPVAGDLRRLLAAIEIAGELERIGDYAKSIAKKTISGVAPPANPPALPIPQMAERAIAMLHDVLDGFRQRDLAAAQRLKEADDQVDALEDQTRSELLALIHRDPTAAEWAIDYLLIAHAVERIADRATNIAERIVFVISGERVELNS